MSRPLFFFASVFSASVFLIQLDITYSVRLCLLVLFALSGAFVVKKKYSKKEALILFFAVVCAVLWFIGYEAFVYRPVSTLDGYSGEIRAQISGYPENAVTYSSVNAKLISPKAGGLISSPQIILYLKDGSSDLKPGDTVSCEASISLPQNLTGFDYAAYRRGRGVFLTAYQEDGYQVQRAQKLPLQYYPAAISEKLGNVVGLIGGENAGLMKSLITGDKSGIDSRLKVALSDTGTSHVAVVSGMHIAFLTGLILLFFGNGVGKWVAFPSIFLFMAVAGFTPSVTRAGIMHMLMISAPILKRESDQLTSLGAALFLILLYNPYAVKDAGLLLSFGATLGIILFATPLSDAFNATFISLPHGAKKVFDPAVSIISITLAATVFTLPLTGIFFERFSLISPLSNLLILPIISVSFSFVLISAALGIFLPVLAAFIIKLPSFLIGITTQILYGLAKIPYASVQSNNLFFVIFAAVLYLAVFVFTVSREKKRAAGTCILSCILVFTAAALFSGNLSGKVQKTTVLSSFYGGRCIVVSRGDKAVMIDCGSGSFGESADFATDYLLKNGIKSIDSLILTSYDAFHAGAVTQLIKTCRIGKILFFPSDGNGSIRDISNSAEQSDIPVYTFSNSAKVKEGDINYTLLPTVGGGALVKFPSANGDMLIATIKNAFALAHLFKTEEIKCDILMMDRAATNESAAMKLIFEYCRPDTMVLFDGYSHPESGFFGFNGRVSSTGENGVITLYDHL